MKKVNNIFNQIISLENLFLAWEEFKSGKGFRPDVLKFDLKREENIFALHRELTSKKYKHSPYSSFRLCDPKPRLIHKAIVRDRLVHHAAFRILNPVFEPSFIAHSFSCRIGKGNHKGFKTLARFLRKVSRNGTRHCFVLKCDIKKFFASIDHEILKTIISQRIKDQDALWLFNEIIDSHQTADSILSEREREREQLQACPRLADWQFNFSIVCQYLHERTGSIC